MMNNSNRKSSRLLESGAAYLFLLPGFVLLVLFIIYPMIFSLRISFFDWNVINTSRSTFVGLDNYREIFSDAVFRRAMLNTLLFTIITIPIELGLALIVAALLNQQIRFKAGFRVAYYLPVITQWVIVTLIFEFLFNSQAGLINYLLRDVLHLVNEQVRWLADPILAWVPIDLLAIWKGVGWSMVIILAGLQEIPKDLLEVAAVDGATPWQRFWRISFPLLRPILVFLLVVRVIGGLNVYTPVLIMTDGGNPLDLTHSVLTLMYEETFDKLHFGMGAAISYVLTLLVFIVSVAQIRLLRQRVEV